MTAISALNQNFDGTAGATATAGAIGATALVGTGTATFDSADPKEGSTCLKLVGATGGVQMYAQYDFTAVTTFWDDVYVKLTALPAAALTIASWFGNSGVNQGGGVRVNTDGTVALRDLNTAVWTSPTALPFNVWVRLSVKAIPGSSTGHRLRIYTSSAGNAPTPDMDSGDQPAVNGINTNIDRFNIGCVTGGANTIYVDRNRGENATEPAGITTGLPPTVNAGPDLTKNVGASPFTITGVATPSSGATIASRSWQILSGNTVTLSGTTTDTVTITPPTSTTGTTVLRYTATQNDGQSTTDDVTLTWVAAGQTLYPAADVSNAGGWTTQAGGTSNLFATIDDPVLDTTDYIASPQLSATPTPYRYRLGAITPPLNGTGWFEDIVVASTADVASVALTVKLYEADGTTLRKTWTPTIAVTGSWVEYQLSLTPTEVAAITTWTSGLIIEFSVTGS